MKQRITFEEIKELSEEQSKKLNELWEPKEYDLAVDRWGNVIVIEELSRQIVEYGSDCGTGPTDVKKEDYLPLLNIGQMLQLLIDFDKEYYGGMGFPFSVDIDLCDSLWSDIKEQILV